MKSIFQSKFLKEWLLFNILGWFLGLLIFVVLYRIIPVLDYEYYKTLSYLFPVIFSFPLGLGLGIMQQIKLRKRGISGLSWTLATTLGFGIPWTLISWLRDNLSLDYQWDPYLDMARIIIVGACIGGLQAYILRKSTSLDIKPGSWILAYTIGLPALVIVEFIIYIIPVFIFAKPLLRLFREWGWWGLISYREIFIFSFIALTIPFFAALFIGLPTGRKLQRFDNMETSK
jgi:hypothetical protein